MFQVCILKMEFDHGLMIYRFKYPPGFTASKDVGCNILDLSFQMTKLLDLLWGSLPEVVTTIVFSCWKIAR